MSKKIIAILLASLLILSFAACAKEDNSDSDGTTTAGSGDTTAEGGDTTTETTAETTPEETTEAPPKNSYYEIYLGEDDGSGHSPHSLMGEGLSIATRFVIKEGFLESMESECPSWSNDIGSLTVKIFTWNTDYDTTVAGTPVFSETFEDYSDNAKLLSALDTETSKGIPAGEYLWWLGDGVDESGSGVGIWRLPLLTEDETLISSFVDGVESDFGWRTMFYFIVPAA